MKIFSLSALDLLLIIVPIVVLFLGISMIALSGVYIVKKNMVYVIEKYNQFDKLLYEGKYFLTPLVYHKAAKYSLLSQTRTLSLENGNNINFTYKIVDVYKYHYTKTKINDYLNKIVKNVEHITFEYIKEEFNKVGIEVISIQKI